MKLIATLFSLTIAFFAAAQTAPTFTNGSRQTLSVCKNSGINIIDTKMIVLDPDASQNISYTIVVAPINGTLHGFPKSISTGTGGILTPTGFDYQPANNYTGLDSFTVNITDGSFTAQTKIIVTVNDLPVVSNITGNTTVCIASNSQLLNATAGGVWSSNNSFVASVNNAGSIATQAQGNVNIKYTVTNASTGCSNNATISISVVTPPTVQPITGNTAVCAGLNATLNSLTTGGIWQSADTSIAKVSSNGLVNGIAAGNTTINYTVANAVGCSTTVVANMLVNSLPVLSAISANKTVICVGTYTYFSNTNTTGVWYSSNKSIATVESNGEVDGIGVGIATITYKVVGANGCSDSAKADISVAAPPATAPTVGPSKMCVGSSVTVSNAVAGGVWSIAPASGGTIDANGVVTAISSSYLNIYYKQYGASGCSNTVYFYITANAVPVVGNITGNSQVCVGDYTTLTNTNSGGVWSSANPSKATIDTTGRVLGVSAGTDTIFYKVTNSYNCSTTVSFDINVNATLAVPAIAGVTNICMGTTPQFTNSLSGGTWASTDFAIATVVNGKIYPVKVGVATISYTVGSGACKGVSYKNISINPLPAIGTIAGPAPICVSNKYQYTNSVSNGVWSCASLTYATIDANGLVSTKANTINTPITITYSTSNQYGCKNSIDKVVNVNTKNVISPITGTDIICVGSTVQLYSSGNVGVWRLTNTNIASITTLGKITGIVKGIDTVYKTFVNSLGCASDTVFKVIKIDSSLKIDPIQGSSKACLGNNAANDKYYTSKTTGGVWTCDDTSKIYVYTASTPIHLLTKKTGRVNVIYTVNYGNGCTAADSLLVTIYDAPAKPKITGRTNICSFDTAQFIGTPTGGKFGTSSSSSSNGYVLDSITGLIKTSAYSQQYSTNISYYAIDTNGCRSSIEVFYFTIDSFINLPNTITPLNSFCLGDTTTLKHSTPGGKWQLGYISGRKIDENFFTLDSNTGFLKANAEGSQYVYYFLKQSTGCPKVWYQSANVGTPISVDSTLGVSTICVGNTTNLYNSTLSSSGAKGLWTSNNTAIATVSSTGLVTSVSSGVCSITYAVKNSNLSCQSRAIKNLIVNSYPVMAPILSPIGVNAVCVGDSIKLSNTTPSGVWLCSDTAKAVIDSVSGNLKGKSQGFVTIGYNVSGGGCNATAFSNGFVYAVPQVNAIAGADTICVGNSLPLINDSSGGIWTSSNPSIATVSIFGIVAGISPGKATISYNLSNNSGCVKGVSKDIVVVGLPVLAPITGKTSFCISGKSNLFNATSNGVWFSKDTLVAKINSLTGLVTPIATGSTKIIYIVSNAGGCKDSATTIVTINSTPVVSQIIGNSSVCVGATTNFYNSTIGGLWSINNSINATINSSGLLTGLVPGFIIVKYKVIDLNGCSDSITKNFNVSPLPIVASIIGSNAGCVASVINMSTTTSGGVWSSSNTTIATVNSNGAVLGISAGNITLKYTVINGNGCVDSVTKFLTINSQPTSPLINGSNNICVGLSTNFSSNISGGNWTVTNSSISQINSSGLFTGLISGNTNVNYSIIDNNGCDNFSSIIVVINPKPTVNVTSNSPVAIGQTIQLNASSTSTISTLGWSGPNGFISTNQNPIINSAASTMIGLYKVAGISSFGCKSDTASVYVVVGDSYSVSGRVITPLKKEIKNVNIKVSGTTANTYQSDATGNYNCTNLPNGNYLLKLSKNNDVTKSNGVTTADVILMQRHILNLSKISNAYKLIAADVNNDKIINSTDVIRMKRLILGLDTTFTGNRLWAFVDSAYQFPDTTNPFPYRDSISFNNLVNNKTNQTFIGVKLGDVNYDWKQNVAKGTLLNPIELFHNDTYVSNDDIISIPLRVKNFNDIVAMQFTLRFNNDVLEYVAIKNNAFKIDYNDSKAKDGTISFLWTDFEANAKTLDDGTAILIVQFRKKKSFETTEISINSDITDVEAYDNNYQLHSIKKGSGKIINKQSSENKSEVITLKPNPSKGLINIEINCDRDRTTELVLADVYGKIRFKEKFKLTNGLNNLRLNLQKNSILANGIYLLKSIGLDKDFIQQLVIMK